MSTFLKSVHNINARKRFLEEQQALRDQARLIGAPEPVFSPDPLMTSLDGRFEGREDSILAPSEIKRKTQAMQQEKVNPTDLSLFNDADAVRPPEPSEGFFGAAKDIIGKGVNQLGDKLVADTVGWAAYKGLGGGSAFSGALSTLGEGERAKIATKYDQYVKAHRKYEKDVEWIETSLAEGRLTPERYQDLLRQAQEARDSIEWTKEELDILNSTIAFRGNKEATIADLINTEERARYWKDLLAGNSETGQDNFLGTNKWAAGGDASTQQFMDSLTEAQKESGYDEKTGLDKFLTGAKNTTKAVIDNPRAVFGEAGEEIVGFFGPGRVSKAAMFAIPTINEGLENYSSAVEERAKKSGQVAPSDQDRLEAAAWTALGTTAEFFGDAALRKLIGASPLGPVGNKVSDVVTNKVGEGVIGSAAKGTSRIGSSMVSEGATEAFQSYTEQRAKDVDTINQTDIWAGAGLGAGAGGTITTGNELANPLKNAASFGLDKATQIGPINRAKEAYDGYRETKIQSNMFDADFFDVGNENYNPAVPFDRLYSSLTEASDLASIETKEAELNSLYESATQAAEAEVSRYEQVRDIDQSIEKIEELIAKETDEEKKAKLEETLGKYVHTRDNVDLDVLKQIADKATAGQEAADAAYIKARTQLRTARKKAEVNASTESTYTPLTNEDLANSTNSTDTYSYLTDQAKQTTNTEDLSNILTDLDKVRSVQQLASTDPEVTTKLDSDYQAAKVVVENRINQANKSDSGILGSSPASNVLSNPLASLEDVLDAIEKTTDPVELEQLRELELAKRLQADTKNLKDTNNDVLKGNKAHRNLGINDYNQAIAEAIETKDAKLFERTMNLLDKWSKTHRSKADAVKQAYQNFLDGNPNTNVYRSTDGTWFLSDKPVSARDRDINRALAIGANSMKLVNTINSEADTIDASYDAYVNMAEKGLHGKIKTRKKKGTKNTKPINTAPKKTGSTQQSQTTQETDSEDQQQKAPKQPVETPSTPTDTTTPTSTQEAPVEQSEATEDDSKYTGTPAEIAMQKANDFFKKNIGDNQKNIIRGSDTGIPDSEFEADSGNFIEVADGKEELIPELKKVANGELFAADYEQALEGSNKFIGFGSSKQAWRTKQAFGERANAASTRAVVYEADDTVFIHADNNPKNLSPQSLARDGIHQAKNTNFSFTTVRKLEIDAAIAAGSTIKMIPPNMRTKDKYTVLNEIAAYLESKGYKEAKGTFTKTAKKKVEPETKVETPTQEEQVTPTEPEVKKTPKEPKVETKEETKPTVKEEVETTPEVEEETNTTTPIEEVSYSLNDVGPKGKNSPKNQGTPNHMTNGWWSSDWVHKVEEKQPDNEFTTTEENHVESTAIKDSTSFTQKPTRLTKLSRLFTGLIRTKNKELIKEVSGVEVTDSNMRQLDSFIRLQALFTQNLLKAYDPTAVNEFDQAAGVSFLANLLVEVDEFGNPSIPEHVVTAMTKSVYQNIQKFGDNVSVDEAQLRSILGLPEDVAIPLTIYNKYKDLGQNRQSFYQEIGAAVMRDLGIRPTKEALVPEEHEMAASIGMWVEHVASNYEASGLYTTTTMTVYEKLTDIADHMDAEALKEAMSFYGLGNDLPHNATKEELELELYNKKSMLQAQIAFIRPNIHVSYEDKEGNPRAAKTYHKLVLDILQSSKHKDGSEDLIDALLSEEKETKKPLEEPIKEFKQNSIKNTRQAVPRIIKDMLSKVAQTVWGIRTEQANTMINLYDSNKDQFFAMFGIQSEESLANEHPLLREKKLSEWAIRKEALEAKIDWLKARQIKDEDGNVTGYKTYFMLPVVYSNHRIGYESTLWNAQSDKFDRMLTRLEEWETTVNASEALLKDGVSTVHGRYLRALAENMEGITKELDFNTEHGVNYDDSARTVDKIAPLHFMNPFKEYLDTNEELHAALDAAEKMIEGVQLSSEEVQIITQYLDKMDSGDMAVGTLIELVKYRRAKETGSTFTTDISSQSDGVTNGPVTTQILYGIATLEGLMKQGGVLSADEDTNFFDQKARGELDYYQDNAAEQVKKARDYVITPAMKAMVALINQIDRSFGERKGAKILVTPFNYGAGFRKLKSAVVKGFESSMEKKFFSIYSASDKDQALAEYNSFMKEAVDQYNRVFKGQADTPIDFRENVINLVYLNNHQGRKPISFVYFRKLSDGSRVETAKSPQQLLEDLTKNLDAKSLKGVESILRDAYSPAVHKDLTLEDIEGDVPLAHRKVMKDLVGMTWGVASVNAIKSTATDYIEVRNEVTALTGHAFDLYDTLKSAYMARLGKQYHEMTLAEVDEMYKYLSDYSAVVDSAHSAQMGGNNGASGLLMANETLQQNNDVEVKGRFKPMNAKQARKLKSSSSTGTTSDKTTQKSSKVMWRVETKPAARGMALQIQSTDSRVSLHTVYRGPYMNFHDANPGSIADMQFVPMVQNQNKAYFDMLVGYDAHVSMVEGLLRPLRGIIHELRMGNGNSLDIFKLVYDTNYGTDREPADLTQYISTNIDKAFTTEIKKLKLLKRVKVVHQYAGAEGPYYVTEEDIKAIDAKIARLEKTWDAMAERYSEKTLDKLFQDQIEKNESQEAPVLPEITSKNEMAFAKTGEERQEIFDKQITSDEVTLGSIVGTLSLVPDTSTGSVISELLGHLKDFQDDFTDDIPIKNVSRSERPEIFQNSNQDYFFSKIDNTIYVNSDLGTYSPSEVSKAMFRAVLHNNFMAFKNGSLRHPNLVKSFKVLKQVGRALHYGNEYDLISTSENLSPEEFNYITEAMQKYVTSSEDAGGHFANAEALMELALYDPTARNILNKITVPDTARTLLSTIKDFIASVLNLKNPTKQAAVALGDLLFETSNYLVQGTKDARGDMTLQEFIDDSFLSHENNTTVYRNSEITPEHGLSARFEFEMARLRRKAYGGPVSSVEVLDMLQGLVENAESITTTGQMEMEMAKQTIEIIRKYLGNNVDFVFVGDLGDVLNNEEAVGNSNTAELASIINDMAQGRSWHIPHAKGSTIYMPLASITDITNTSPTVALHELVHGFTSKSMRANKDSAATKAITALYEELQPLMADFDAHKNPYIEYASTNVDEFLAEALTNAKVEEFIVKNSDKVDAKKLQKLLQAATGIKQEEDFDIFTAFYSMVDALGEQNKQQPDWVELPEPSLTPVTGITSTAVYNMGLSHSDKDMRGLIHPSDVQRAQDQLAETNVENNSVIEESEYFVSDNTAPIPFDDIPYDDLPFDDYTLDQIDSGNPHDFNEDDYFSPGPQGSAPGGNRQQATLFSPQEVFDNLETDTDNKEELDRAMRDFVNPLLSLINPELLTGYDIDRVWHDAVLNNETVFVSDLNAAGFDLSDQQAFVLETIETAVYEMLDEVGATRIYRQLLRTYQAAKASVRPQDFHNGDWNQATPEEKSTAQDKYNEIFNTPYTPGEDKSHFMAKYIALSAVSPEFRDILDRRTPTVKAEDRTNFEKVIDVLKAVMDTIYGMVSASVTPSSTVIDRTDKLASKLVKVYQVHMDKANRRQSAIRRISETVLDTVSELPAKGIAKAADAFSKLPYIRNNGLGKITQQAAAGNLRYIMDVLDTSMDDTFRNQPIGELRQAVNEVIGTDSKEELRGVKDHVMLHNFIQQKREEIVDSLRKQLLSAFHESNQNMSKEQKAAVTKVLLRTDAQKLMNKFGYNRLIEMLRDPSHIFMEIAQLETTIEQDPYGNEYIIRSKMLADYMVHRAADKHNMLAKNANAIVERFGLDEAPEYIEADMVDNVDTLVSLYALLNTKPEERAMVVNINSNETTNGINGLKLTLETYAAEVKVAEQQFKYNPWSIQKGYLPNIVDDTKGFEVIHPDHREDYERMGFIYAGPVKKSSLENTGDKIMMILPHNGNQKFVSGAISTQDTEKSGKLIFDSTDKQLIAARETAKAEFLELVNNTNHKNYTRDIDEGGLIPSYNENGDIISFSYEMTSHGLDKHLKRNNDFTELVSQYAGGNDTRQRVPTHNKELIDFLNAMDARTTGSDRNKMLEVGPDAPTEKGREYWALLPSSTKNYVTDTNGQPTLWVRKDMANTVFGFTKYSPSEAIKKERSERNVLEMLYGGFFELFFGEKAELKSNTYVAMWQELIKKLKSFEVIRNWHTFVGNVVSNEAFLMINGFEPIQAHKDLFEAAKGSLQYQRDVERLNQLKNLLRTGNATPTMVSELQELRDSIARNPLTEFIRAGMMPTIVNDVSLASDDYTFQSTLEEELEGVSSKVPGLFRKTGKTLLMSEDTAVYKFMAQATQQSDFIYKYAVYKQELRKGKSKQNALRTAREMFIEYDVPTSKGMQFLNDMGVWTYTKFAFRVQRVLFKFVKEKAGGLILADLALSALGFQTTASLFLYNSIMSNPLRVPIWDVITMADESMLIQLVLKLFM